MQRLALLPLFAFALACSDSSIVNPEDALTIAAAVQPGRPVAVGMNATKMIPFKGKNGSWWDGPIGAGCEGSEDNIGAVSPGVINATHLGRSEYIVTNCWAVDPESPIGLTLISQTGQVTGANGDRLYWYGSDGLGTVATFNLEALTYEMGPFWFTGGTGRFDGATGEFRSWGTLAADFLTGTENWSGVISSPGSIK